MTVRGTLAPQASRNSLAARRLPRHSTQALRLLALVGGWLGGHGDADDVRQGLAWSYVPLAATAILWIPQILVHGSDAFNPNKPYETLVQWATLPLKLAIGVAILWCVPLVIAALAEALHVSVLRSIAVLTLAALPFLLLALLR